MIGMGRNAVVFLVLTLGLLARSAPAADLSPSATPQDRLVAAVRAGDLKAVRRAYAQGASLGLDARSGATPLHHAANTGAVKIAAWLLDQGADINAPDVREAAPLTTAVRSGCEGMVRLLLGRGADPLRRDVAGRTAVLWAWFTRLTPAPNLRRQTPCTGDAVDQMMDMPQAVDLETAAVAGRVELARTLLGRGADPGATSVTGYTPLQRAVIYGHGDMVNVLLEAGAAVDGVGNPPEPNLKGRTPLTWAAWLNQTDLLAPLLDAGADVNAQQADGRTALYSPFTNVARYLLSRGASPDLGGQRYGSSPLHEAVLRENLSLVGVLLAGGASVNVKNRDGKTPLDLAAQKGLTKIVDALKGGGAGH